MAEGNVLPTFEYLQSKWCSSKEPALARLAGIILGHDREGLEQFLKTTDWDINQMFPVHVAYESVIVVDDKRSKLFRISSESPDHCESYEEISNGWIAAIHLVVDECWCEGLQVLVQAGADLNLCDYSVGRHLLRTELSSRTMFTPMMRAITSSKVKRLKFIKDLLIHVPNLRCPNTNLSMIDLAVEFRNQPVVDLLLKKYRIDLTGSFQMNNYFKQDILWLACENTVTTVGSFFLSTTASRT